ncbi:hypothetical protein [Leifsonia poae]|uniref:hypothetical protein n=1 Tax=Leifsonia poae TaxID=110933 RepID=UPI003D672E16
MERESPSPKPWEASDEEAVELCREWMVYLGAVDTVVASGATRLLCDLYSSLYVAWVDNRQGNLDVDVVEKAASLASADGRRALIFVTGGVRPVAQDLADALGVALLRYGAHGGDLDGANTLGRQLHTLRLNSE